MCRLKIFLWVLLGFGLYGGVAQAQLPSPAFQSVTIQTPLGYGSGGTNQATAAAALVNLNGTPQVANLAALKATTTATYPAASGGLPMALPAPRHCFSPR